MASITPLQLRAIRQDIDAALVTIAGKHGLTALRAAKCTYSAEGSFKFAVEGLVSGGLSVEAERYNLHRELLGLPELGFEFDSRRGKVKVTGINTTGTKVIAACSDGKTYLFPADHIARRYGTPGSQVSP